MKPTPLPPPAKPLEFITIVDLSGRTSSLSIGGRRDNGTLVVVGGLSHNAEFEPDSIADANRLIKWLEEWKVKKSA